MSDETTAGPVLDEETGAVTLTVPIELKVYPADSHRLFMSTYAGEGRFGDDPIELCIGGWGGTGTPLVKFGEDGAYEWVASSWDAFIRAAAQAREEAQAFLAEDGKEADDGR